MSALKLPRFKSLRPLWQALTPRRRKQLLGLQLLSVVAAGGEVANLGALLPFLRLLANPSEGLKALGTLAAPLRGLPEQHLLLGLGLGFMMVVAASTLLRVFAIRTQLLLSALIAAYLGDQVFAAVLQKPYAWHLQHNSSSVLGHLTNDVSQAFGTIQALLIVVVNLAIVVLLGGSLIALAPGVMLVIGALMAAFYVLVFRFTRGGCGPMASGSPAITKAACRWPKRAWVASAMFCWIAANLSFSMPIAAAFAPITWHWRRSTPRPRCRVT